MGTTTPSASSEQKSLSLDDIREIVAVVIQQEVGKMGARVQQLESKQAQVDATIQQLPGLVQQFQASLPEMISQVVQQHLAVVTQSIPQQPPPQSQPQQAPSAGGDPTGSPQVAGGAGAIPLGLEVPQAQAQSPPAPDQGPPQMQMPVPQQQTQANQLQQQKASEMFKQLMARGGGGPAMGGNGFGDLIQQLLIKKLLGGGEKQAPDMMQQLMGLGQMFEQLTGFFSMVVNAVDAMRGNLLDHRHREAQIQKVEAESQATVLRAMHPAKKTGGSKK